MRTRAKIAIAIFLAIPLCLAAVGYWSWLRTSGVTVSTPVEPTEIPKATAAVAEIVEPELLTHDNVLENLAGYRLGEPIETFQSRHRARSLTDADGRISAFVGLDADGLPMAFRLTGTQVLMLVCPDLDFVEPVDPDPLHRDCETWKVLDTASGKLTEPALPGFDPEFQSLTVKASLLAYHAEDDDMVIWCRVYDWAEQRVVVNRNTGVRAHNTDAFAADGWPFFAVGNRVVCAIPDPGAPDRPLIDPSGRPLRDWMGLVTTKPQIWLAYALPEPSPRPAAAVVHPAAGASTASIAPDSGAASTAGAAPLASARPSSVSAPNSAPASPPAPPAQVPATP